jgi:hypothetical protein
MMNMMTIMVNDDEMHWDSFSFLKMITLSFVKELRR